MSDIPVTIQLGTFPVGYCWPGAQQYANDLIALLKLTVPNATVVGFGPNPPADPLDPNAINPLAVWVRTVNGYLEGIYTYYNGGWYRPHPVPPSSSSRQLWVGSNDGSVGGLWNYDGGDGSDPVGSPPTAITGSMWQVDHAFDFKIPMGPGTSPNTYNSNPARTIAVGGTLGSEMVQLASSDLPVHSHFLAANDSGNSGLTNSQQLAYSYTNPGGFINYTLTASNVAATLGLSGDITTRGANPETYHENVPPVIGTWVIKRTTRQFIKGI